jgi:hypothetical protein
VTRQRSFACFLVVLASVLVFFLAHAELFPPPLQPFRGESRFSGLLLATRVCLLGAVLLGTPGTRTLLVALTTSGLFVASLASTSLFVPFSVVALAAFLRASLPGRSVQPSTNPARPDAAALWTMAGAVVLIALAASTSLRKDPRPPVFENPAKETTYWLERDNLFRARDAAARWVNVRRAPPDAPELLLARIEWELGHHDAARARTRAVAAETRSPAVARDAARLLAEWVQP